MDRRRLLRAAFAVVAMLLVFTAGRVGAQETITIDSIALSGNHKTHPSVIFRELTLKKGDTLSDSALDMKIKQSRENLLNLPLFNFVEVAVEKNQKTKNGVIITFTFTERWYIWPYPILEVADRNFNAWWKTQNLSRINFGGYVLVENFRGRLERLKLLAKGGFDQKFEIEYFRPYVNRMKTLGLLFQAGLMGNHEVAASTDKNNDVIFLRNDDHYNRTYFSIYSALVYRPVIHNTHEIGIGWSANNAADTLTRFNPTLWPNRHEQYLSLHYQFKHDRRDYRHYPLNGRYFDLSLSSHFPLSATSSHTLYHEAETNLRFYGPITSRTWWATGFYGRLSSQQPVSYYLMQGLGNSRYFVRGYEYYLIDGQQTALFKSNIIYALVKPTEHRVHFIHNEKFGRLHYAVYLRAFTDCGITHNTIDVLSSKLANTWLVGYGVGCDLVTYYDRVLRVEYSFNRMGESGIFIHFMASI